MSLIEKIPSMSDAALGNLLANARHLVTAGGPKQQADAAELLPAQVRQTRGRRREAGGQPQGDTGEKHVRRVKLRPTSTVRRETDADERPVKRRQFARSGSRV
jgi:hypothetical protein